jgi:rubrerythrin
MPINKIEEFSCHLCGYITRDKDSIERIRKTGICPACRNGRSGGWHYANHTPIHKC